MTAIKLAALRLPRVWTVREGMRKLQNRIWSKMDEQPGLSYLDAYKECLDEDAAPSAPAALPAVHSVAAGALLHCHPPRRVQLADIFTEAPAVVTQRPLNVHQAATTPFAKHPERIQPGVADNGR